MVASKKATKKPQEEQRIESNKQVTFSRRQSGLFRKAGELSALCSTDVTVLIISSNGKLYYFCHPSIDAILNWFLHGKTTATISRIDCLSSNSDHSINSAGELERDYANATKELEAEKSRMAEEKEKKKEKSDENLFWWDEGLSGMRVELEQHMAALCELKQKVAARLQEDVLAVEMNKMLQGFFMS